MGGQERPQSRHSASEAFSAQALTDHARQQLAAIVESSEDAILTKDLNGVITSWNRGAEQLFGYSVEEAIGEPVTLLIPSERHDEESVILDRIRRGERVHPYETVRQRKDGSLVDISLTVSPLRDEDGNVIGASKIARDITERRRAQEQQRLLMAELQHRIKNLFSLADSLVSLCASRAETPSQLADMVRSRLQALSRALSLTIPSAGGEAADEPSSLHAVLRALLAPHLGEQTDRLLLSGDDTQVAAKCVTPLALVLNELVTNASKHGALHEPSGTIAVEGEQREGQVLLRWKEHVAVPIESPPHQSGFGSRLMQATLETQLGGTIEREWEENGLCVTLVLDSARLTE